MPFEDDPDDDRPTPDRPLPPDDRLWRHPSELGVFGPGPTGTGPTVSPPTPRGSSRSLLAGAVLAGAALAFGAMWFARPVRVVERDTAAKPNPPTRVAFSDTGLAVGQLADDVGPSVVRLAIDHGGTWSSASAVWVDRRGTLVTSAHAIDGADRILAYAADGTGHEVRVAGVDQPTGLAALIASGTDGRPAEIVTNRPDNGTVAAVVGAGDTEAGTDHRSPTVATVVVRSAGDRATVAGTVLHDSLQLDRTVPDDAIGAAVVDARGRVIGLVVGNSDDRHLGAVIPADVVVDTAALLRTDGAVRRARLGVQAVDLDPGRSSLLRVPGGALLTEVTPASPAAVAGLLPGDVITAVAGHPIDDASDLVVALRGQRPGARVTLRVQRGADTMSLAALLD